MARLRGIMEPCGLWIEIVPVWQRNSESIEALEFAGIGSGMEGNSLDDCVASGMELVMCGLYRWMK